MTVISEHWCNGLATAAGMLEDGEVTASIVGVTELMRDDGAGSEEEAGCCHGRIDGALVESMLDRLGKKEVSWNGRCGRSVDNPGTCWNMSE